MSENPYASPTASQAATTPSDEEGQSLVRAVVSRGIGIGGLTGMATASLTLFVMGLIEYFSYGPFELKTLPFALLILAGSSVGIGIMVGSLVGAAAGVLVAAMIAILASFRLTCAPRFLSASALVLAGLSGGGAAWLGSFMTLPLDRTIGLMLFLLGAGGGMLGGLRLGRSVRELLQDTAVSATSTSTHDSPEDV